MPPPWCQEVCKPLSIPEVVMKGCSILLWIFFILAGIAFIVGIFTRVTHLAAMGLAPMSLMRFTGVCLLFCIALSLAQISLKK